MVICTGQGEPSVKCALEYDALGRMSASVCTGQVESSVEYAYTKVGRQQVASHTLNCPDQQMTYNVQYSEYTYDEIGRTSGFSVLVETSLMN